MTTYLNYGTVTEKNARVGAGASGERDASTLRRRSHFDHDNTRTWAGETMQMQNIPTDLLRTLIAVVDLRSFTKAAQMLGVTQPAVSAQIKRLQSLIGYELLDKSAPGVSLTQRGDDRGRAGAAAVGHQRRDPAGLQRPLRGRRRCASEFPATIPVPEFPRRSRGSACAGRISALSSPADRPTTCCARSSRATSTW